jgi:hypothetical protein
LRHDGIPCWIGPGNCSSGPCFPDLGSRVVGVRG